MTALPDTLRREIAVLKAAGFGGIRPPEQTPWGWALNLTELVLPNGIRTDALILLPKNYPLSSPIGFYVRDSATTGNLDASHLFSENAFHGAHPIPGWRWFCGIADGWQPGRHTLLSYLAIVLSLFGEQP